MEEKAKHLAKEEADKENNQVKEFILQQAQESFQRCINSATSEDDKKSVGNNTNRTKSFITITGNKSVPALSCNCL